MAMTFSTLMVHLEVDHPNDVRLRIAGELADLFGAKVIGVAAADPKPPYYADGAVAHSLVESERADLKRRIAAIEEQFRLAMQQAGREAEWRTAMEAPADFVTAEARAADLIIAGVKHDDAFPDPRWRLDPSDLVMRAGRPVLVVPHDVKDFTLKNAVVAWTDTREARRAVSDALPLLQKAKNVDVIEVVRGGEDRAAAQARVNDVAIWLRRHDVQAFGEVLGASDERGEVERIWEHEADVIVAGAYGHARLREWVFGGFTRSLLTRSQRCALLSH